VFARASAVDGHGAQEPAVAAIPALTEYRRRQRLYKNYLLHLGKVSTPDLGPGLHYLHPPLPVHTHYHSHRTHSNTRVSRLSLGERYIAPYRDYLQSPLQPLQDHLESTTYETFERDPAKYTAYEQVRRMQHGRAMKMRHLRRRLRFLI